jgi:2-oxoglutarate dehydrogenase E1 component
LRHPKCVSSLDECAKGNFQRVIGDTTVDAANVTRVLLCSGKIYYELLARREELSRKDVAIVRIEQFYPLQTALVAEALESFRSGIPVVWVQDEPHNMGAWRHLRARFGAKLLSRHPFSVVCRAESASPATGSGNAHKLEQQEILEKAFVNA